MAPTDRPSPPASFMARACETCRVRKIRCDKAIPCSSCRTLGVECQAASRTTEHRPRVVISSYYEKQLELIQERLLSIEQNIRNISQVPARVEPPHEASLLSSANPVANVPVRPFEGESSFGVQTLQASQAAQLLGEAAPTQVTSALASLRQSLETQEHASAEAYISPPAPGQNPPESSLPPVGLAVALMRKAKVYPPCTLVNWCWRDLSQIDTLCQKLYFPSEPCAAGSVTLLNGLLHYIIRDFMHAKDMSLAGFDLPTYKDMTERAFVEGLQTYETMAIPTLENIQVLFLAASKAQEQSNLSLCWTYLSAATAMCQTLGFHRSSQLKTDTNTCAETKRHVFWGLYSMDKNISLNLGRTSHFNDSDIDVEYFTPSQNQQQRPWDLLMLSSVGFSRLQGQVYDRLYSAAAAKTDFAHRTATVEELSTRLLSLRDDLLTIDMSRAYYSEILVHMVAIADYLAYSVLTVIHRAQCPSGNVTEISAQCFQYAQLSLQGHLKCFASFRHNSTWQQVNYVVSILLYPSFTPFIIVFIHAIATFDENDLLLLKETVGSLEIVKDVSRGATRLFKICKAFLQAAEALFASGRPVNGLHHHENGTLILPTTSIDQVGDGANGFSFPDPSVDFGLSNADMPLFLCNWLGTDKPVMDMLNLEFADHDVR